MKPSLSVISFMNCAFGVVSKTSITKPSYLDFSPILSSRSFTVLYFTFRSAIHFELIFVSGVRSVSRFIFFACDVQLYQCHLLKRWTSLHLLRLLLYQRSIDYIFIWAYSWTLYSVPSIRLSILSQYHTALITVAL